MISRDRIPAWLHRWLPALILLAVAVAALSFYLAREQTAGWMIQAETWRLRLLRLGSWAPLVYVLLYISQIVFPPLPGGVLGTVGGYLFGLTLGLLYNFIGLVIGASLALWVARRWGQPLAQRLAGSRQWLTLQRLTALRSPWIWAIVFLLPAADIAYFIAGLTRAPLRQLLLAAIIGRSPALVFSTISGAGVALLPPNLVWLPIAALLLAAALGYLLRDRLMRLALRHVE